MNEKNVNQRLIVIGLVIVVGLLFLRNPAQTLRPGIDIAGGTSLIFELDTSDATNVPDLAERVKEQLQRRVDPQGVYDLKWRVQGRNRIEVQMPLPPQDARVRLDDYRKALDELFNPKTNVADPNLPNQPLPLHELTRGQIERAITLPEPDRDAEIKRLAARNGPVALFRIQFIEDAQALPADAQKAAFDQLRSVIGEAALSALQKGNLQARRDRINETQLAREQLLHEAATRYEALQQARAALEAFNAGNPTKTPAEAAAADESAVTETQPDDVDRVQVEDRVYQSQDAYEDAIAAVLRTNLSRSRFQEVLDLEAKSQVRTKSLEDFRETQPDLCDSIENVIAAHANWRDGKRFLDGPNDLKRLLRGSGRLEFRILVQPSQENRTQYDRYRRELTENGRKRLDREAVGWFKIDNPLQFFNFDSQEQLDNFASTYRDYDHYVIERLGEDYYVLADLSPENSLLRNQPNQRNWRLTRASVSRDENGRLAVHFSFDPVGGDYFGQLTRRNLKKSLCIMVDDVAYSAATIQSEIRTNGQITGEFSPEKVNYLVRTMEGGMLPARLKDTPLSERTIGSRLGVENRDMAVRAGMYGAIAVVVVMIGYYLWVCGSIATLALAMNVFLILAAMAMLSARITLVGIAGVILSIGMAVDANVLVFERMREEKLRGTSLRMLIKNGYDKALSTIFDANITTLLTCLIIYFVGSEEVKGFGLTLGWGIVLNLFTSVFVTRTLFAFLLKHNMIKDVKMLQIIGVPNIDWYSKRKFFVPMSVVIVAIGLGLLIERGKNDTLDVEFLGGVAAEFDLKTNTLSDRDIDAKIEDIGKAIAADGEKLKDATLTPVEGQLATYRLQVQGLNSTELAAMVAEPLEGSNLLERGGVHIDPSNDEAITLFLAPEVTAEHALETIRGLAADVQAAGDKLNSASVNAVLEVGGVAQGGKAWNLTTTVTNMRLVEYALTRALGDELNIQPRISYEFVGRDGAPFPITDSRLEEVIPQLPRGRTVDVTDYLGGAAMYFRDLDPPCSVEELTKRLDNMHFQPDFQDQPKRQFRVIGIDPAGTTKDDAGHQAYTSVVLVTLDTEILYREDPQRWLNAVAEPELHLATTALQSEQTLGKVMQFKPQIAGRSWNQAMIALILSWAMIITYLWLRFGRPSYGAAGVIALIHDVLIALAFVGISGWLGGLDHPIGNFLLIHDFKINMTIVAALLTIIGYSINDTIVVFDRIRETRGRLGVVTPEIINASINQTLARTIMTSITTLIVLVIMYIFGGESVRGFNYCMIIGILTGTYSSVAIAAPLLMARFLGAQVESARRR